MAQFPALTLQGLNALTLFARGAGSLAAVAPDSPMQPIFAAIELIAAPGEA